MKSLCILSDYNADEPLIVLFWSTFEELPEISERKMFQFMIGSDCHPARGFADNPITIQKL
jgi:hypothetical protein